MMNQLLEIINAYYDLIELDTNTYKDAELNGIPLIIKSFDAVNFGSVSILSSNSNVMNLDTLILNPFSKDMPLFSYDCIKAFQTDTLFIELYDTLLDKSINKVVNEELNIIKKKYQEISELEHKDNWYDSIRLDASTSKKVGIDQSNLFNDLTKEYLKGYLSISKNLDSCNEELKKAKAKEYTDGLLENGGPSTDAFIKAKGKKYTEKLYREVLFRV